MNSKKKIKLTKDEQIKLLKHYNKNFRNEAELLAGNNSKLQSINEELKEQVQYYEKIHKFDRTHIQERDEINKRLQFRIETLQNAIEVLSIAEMRQRNILNENQHSDSMMEVAAMSSRRGFSITDSRNKEEVLAAGYGMGEKKLEELKKKKRD